jgi:hypothetical protein
MAYEYSEKTLMRWPVEAQAETYRLKFMHQQQETNHWKGRALAAETRLSANIPATAGTTESEK